MNMPDPIPPRPAPQRHDTRLVWGLLLGLVLLFVGYLVWSGMKKRELLAGEQFKAAGVTWLVKEVKTAELWGQVRVDLSLAILRAPSAGVKLDGKVFESVCGQALTNREKLGINVRRSQVFQTRITILGRDMQPTSVQYLPVNVLNGRCETTEKKSLFFPRYLAPLQDWILQDLKYPDGKDGGRIDFWFVWAGAGSADLSTFPYEKACEAALILPALPEIESYLQAHPVRRVGIIAGAERTVLLVPVTRWKGLVFESAGRACGVQLHEVET